MPPRLIQRLIPLLLWLGLAVLYLPSLHRHAEFFSTGAVFSDDEMQHIAPYLRYTDFGPRGEDLLADYFEACHPVGYRMLYRAASLMGDPRIFAHQLQYLLFAVFLASLGWAGTRLGGWAGGLLAVGLALSSEVFLPRIAGGLPRGFGFPIFTFGVASLLAGRYRLTIVAIWLGAAFYPAISVSLGLALAGLLLVRQIRQPLASPGRKQALLLLALAAAGLFLLTLPTALQVKPYGPAIGIAELPDFPEARAGMRLQAADTVDYSADLPVLFSKAIPDILGTRGQPWWPALHAATTPLLPVVSLVAALGLVLFVLRQEAGRGLLMILAGVLIAYSLARLFSPRLFLPERHLAYTLPVIALLSMPAAVKGLFEGAVRVLRGKAPGTRGYALVQCSVLAILLAGWGGRIHERAGFRRSDPGQQGLIAWAATLPREALLAGWPKVLDPVRYLAARRCLATHETALPYHQLYTRLVRERIGAIIDATYAGTPEPLRRLRDQFGVTHFVIFKPFWVEPVAIYPPHLTRLLEYWNNNPRPKPWLQGAVAEAVYEDRDYLVFDLRGLPGLAAYPAEDARDAGTLPTTGYSGTAGSR